MTSNSPPIALHDPGLFRDRAYIDGAWKSADDGREYDILNPADGQVIGRVPRCGAGETASAIRAAQHAQPAWAARTAKDRAGILRRWYDLIIAAQKDLAAIMTTEQGKPTAEAMGEILYAASFVEWFAEEGKRVYGETIPAHQTDKRLVVVREPVGVTAGITPWNFPSAMIARKASTALAAGCAMVLKPAEATPFSALALCELAVRAGIPAGVLSVITGDRADAPVIGAEMTGNPAIRQIGFTGSTAVGKTLMAQAATLVKRVALELGGNAPFIVFDDADIDSALDGLMVCKFRNGGQTCVSANRILVQDGIYDRFVDGLKKRVSDQVVGKGMDEGVTIGPLIDERGLAKVDRLVRAAEAQGAGLSLGGSPHPLGGNFYRPSVIENVTMDMDIANEEIFGPVASVTRFREEQDAIAMANDTPFGLAAYFYARDVGRVWRVGGALESGIVGINAGIISTEVAPFGGIKESGIGREGSRHGIEDWCEIKYLCFGDI